MTFNIIIKFMNMKSTINWFSMKSVRTTFVFIKATSIFRRISVFCHDYEMLYQSDLIYYFNFICLKNKQLSVCNIYKKIIVQQRSEITVYHFPFLSIFLSICNHCQPSGKGGCNISFSGFLN